MINGDVGGIPHESQIKKKKHCEILPKQLIVNSGITVVLVHQSPMMIYTYHYSTFIVTCNYIAIIILYLT